MLSGNQPKPVSQVTSVLEIHAIANGSDSIAVAVFGPTPYSSDPLAGWAGLERTTFAVICVLVSLGGERC